MRSLVLLAALCFSLSPAIAAEQWIEPDWNGQVRFLSPSGNIGCTYTPEGGTDIYEPVGGGPEMRCDRIEPSYVTVILGPHGKAKKYPNPGEQGCCGDDETLDYGNRLELEGFSCVSRKSGLTCESTYDDHGFSVAKAGVKTW